MIGTFFGNSHMGPSFVQDFLNVSFDGMFVRQQADDRQRVIRAMSPLSLHKSHDPSNQIIVPRSSCEICQETNKRWTGTLIASSTNTTCQSSLSTFAIAKGAAGLM